MDGCSRFGTNDAKVQRIRWNTLRLWGSIINIRWWWVPIPGIGKYYRRRLGGGGEQKSSPGPTAVYSSPRRSTGTDGSGVGRRTFVLGPG